MTRELMMTDPLSPTLREYLELRLDYERSLVAQKLELIEQARVIQAKEYERRLDILNHAHEAAVTEQARVLPREIFDVFKREYEIKHADMRAQFDTFKLETATQLTVLNTRAAVWATVVGVIFAVLTILLRFLK